MEADRASSVVGWALDWVSGELDRPHRSPNGIPQHLDETADGHFPQVNASVCGLGDSEPLIASREVYPGRRRDRKAREWLTEGAEPQFC